MSKITPEHLARQAIVYVRQSTADQVINNLESQRREGQFRRAEAEGLKRARRRRDGPDHLRKRRRQRDQRGEKNECEDAQEHRGARLPSGEPNLQRKHHGTHDEDGPERGEKRPRRQPRQRVKAANAGEHCGAEGRRIEWKLPVYNTLYHILTNPIYAGAYAYGRTGHRVTIDNGRKKITNDVKKNARIGRC